MRRAPDNLAAIRGLAELHDRFEHTLNLPMDGPGQWPPPADSVDGEAAVDASVIQASDLAVFEQFETAEPAPSEPGFGDAGDGTRSDGIAALDAGARFVAGGRSPVGADHHGRLR